MLLIHQYLSEILNELYYCICVKFTLVSGWQKPSLKAAILFLGVDIPCTAEQFTIHTTSKRTFTVSNLKRETTND